MAVASPSPCRCGRRHAPRLRIAPASSQTDRRRFAGGRLRRVTRQPKVLVVEDDDAMRQALIAGLGDDADVSGAVDVVDAVRFIAAFQPDVVVLDLLLDPRLGSWSNGVDIPRLLRERHIPVPRLIVLSGRPGGAEIARSIGAAAYY